MQVVDAGQHRPQHFAAAVQVVQIGAAESGAPTSGPRHAGVAGTGVAGAGGIQRLRIGFVAGVADLQIAKAGEQRAVASIARGHNAVKHINSVLHAGNQVLGRTHAHQVMRLVGGQARANVAQKPQHVFLGLAHTQAAHGDTGKVQRLQARQRLLAQVLKHTALHDAEQGIWVRQPGKLGLAALGPAQAQEHGSARLGLRGHPAFGSGLYRQVRGALIELHHDV